MLMYHDKELVAGCVHRTFYFPDMNYMGIWMFCSESCHISNVNWKQSGVGRTSTMIAQMTITNVISRISSLVRLLFLTQCVRLFSHLHAWNTSLLNMTSIYDLFWQTSNHRHLGILTFVNIIASQTLYIAR